VAKSASSSEVSLAKQPAALPALDQNQPFPLLRKNGAMPDVVIVTELPLELGAAKIGRKTCELHPEHPSQVKGGFCRVPPSFHPGVENQQVSGLHLGEAALRRRRIAVGEGFKLGVNVHRLRPCVLLFMLGEVFGKCPALSPL
jgi:hypothetical protein